MSGLLRGVRALSSPADAELESAGHYEPSQAAVSNDERALGGGDPDGCQPLLPGVPAALVVPPVLHDPQAEASESLAATDNLEVVSAVPDEEGPAVRAAPREPGDRAGQGRHRQGKQQDDHYLQEGLLNTTAAASPQRW